MAYFTRERTLVGLAGTAFLALVMFVAVASILTGFVAP